jgi:hypothetical protein
MYLQSCAAASIDTMLEMNPGQTKESEWDENRGECGWVSFSGGFRRHCTFCIGFAPPKCARERDSGVISQSAITADIRHVNGGLLLLV